MASSPDSKLHVLKYSWFYNLFFCPPSYIFILSRTKIKNAGVTTIAMQLMTFPWRHLEVSWVCAKSKEPCFSKKQIFWPLGWIWAWDHWFGNLDKGIKCEQSTFFARTEILYSKINSWYISKREICHVSRKIFRRCEACLDAGGRHFEVLLMAKADICFCTSHKDI